MQGLSVFFFLFCTTFLPDSFIVHFVVITTVLASDFWYVKNVTGRKLVGLRWWSEPSSDGSKSTWQFESILVVANVRSPLSIQAFLQIFEPNILLAMLFGFSPTRMRSRCHEKYLGIWLTVYRVRVQRRLG